MSNLAGDAESQPSEDSNTSNTDHGHHDDESGSCCRTATGRTIYRELVRQHGKATITVGIFLAIAGRRTHEMQPLMALRYLQPRLALFVVGAVLHVTPCTIQLTWRMAMADQSKAFHLFKSTWLTGCTADQSWPALTASFVSLCCWTRPPLLERAVLQAIGSSSYRSTYLTARRGGPCEGQSRLLDMSGGEFLPTRCRSRECRASSWSGVKPLRRATA